MKVLSDIWASNNYKWRMAMCGKVLKDIVPVIGDTLIVFGYEMD